jgi:hypothetical protein
MYIYVHISLNYPQNEKVSDKLYSGNQNPNFIENIFFHEYRATNGKNMEQPVRQVTDNTVIGRKKKRVACWVTNIRTKTHVHNM